MTLDERPIAVLVDREGLGDALLKAPFLRALRRAFPGRDVCWIATHQTAMEDELRPLFRRDIARVIARAGLNGRAGEVLARLRDLPPFWRVFDARTKIATVALARHGLRHEGFYCCLPGYILCDGTGRTGPRPRHIAERMLSLVARASGRAPDGSGWLRPSKAASERARRLFPEGPRYVGVAPGSREAIKNWPMERFVDVARALVSAGFTPVFRIGPMEGQVRAEIEAAAPGVLVSQADVAHAGSPGEGLDRFIAEGQRFDLLLANDNGVGHLLGGAGVPVISLFGPTDPRRWAPVAPANRILRAQDFGGADMASIPTPAVVEAVLAMLAAAPATRPGD
jgi:ADP-heptose:LPS heptosyltransferase